MKWFHHECAARHDPKLQMLGASYGAEGLGIYWGLLEEIGQHSDTFHLKVSGISEDVDKTFAEFLQRDEKMPEHSIKVTTRLAKVPKLPLKLLAKNLFTSPKKLLAVITFCVEVGLFDSRKWLEFNVLYSPAFEHRADDYTRRVRRSSENVRTPSEPNTNRVRTSSEASTESVRRMSEVAADNVRLKTETETEGEEKKKKNKKEEEMLLKNTPRVDNSFATKKSSGTGDELYLIEPSDEVFDEYSLRFHSMIQQWNRKNPAHAVAWQPTIAELRKLFYAGEYEHKLSMCFHAYKLLDEQINYPELVMRALRLMLATNAKAKIDNPFGWMWSCLHGNGNGTKPWVQLLTADEENAAHTVSRRKL